MASSVARTHEAGANFRLDAGQVKRQSNIVELVRRTAGERVKLKSGQRGEYIGLCPIHGDKNPSLSVNEPKGVFNCFACGASGDVFDWVGQLEGIGPFQDRVQRVAEVFGCAEVEPVKPRGEPRPVAFYDYESEDGEVVYRVVRKEPGYKGRDKTFVMERPNGRGGWADGVEDIERVPFHLPRLLAADPNEPVFVVEGEKDVLTVERLGFVATCKAGGASKADQFADWLDGFANHKIVILSDNDMAGRKFAAEVAAILKPIAASVKLVELPDLPEKGDITDWVEAGGTREQLDALVAETPTWTPSTALAKVEESQGTIAEFTELDFTDAGLAALVAKIHGDGIRRALDTGEFLAFDGRRWIRGEAANKIVERLILDVGRDIYERAPGMPAGHSKHAMKAGWRVQLDPGTKAVLSRLAAVESIGTTSDKFDTDGELLNVANGTLNLRTGELHPHRAGDFITRLIDIPYSASAPARIWTNTIGQIFAPNPELVEYLHRVMGYASTGLIREHVFHMLIGTGRNGKSLVIEALAEVFGEYGLAIAAETLAKAHDPQRPRPDVALMRGKRFVFSQEANRNTPFDEALVKRLSGGDTISARVLHQNPITFKSVAKLVLSTNHAPEISGTETAIWRRMRLIPFKVSFAGREDVTLPQKLKAEREGILAWVVAGAKRYFEMGLDAPEVVTEATDEYRRQSDQLGRFVEDRLIFTDGATVAAKRLQDAYRAWCAESGEKERSAAIVAEYFASRGIEKRKGRLGATYHGISLLPDAEGGGNDYV
ncbi:MAG: hypothetical protein FJW36_24640 [Acidobacteria bacterium]|nr:hypothetical protein [Acidobacteriota bacterium]